MADLVGFAGLICLVVAAFMLAPWIGVAVLGGCLLVAGKTIAGSK